MNLRDWYDLIVQKKVFYKDCEIVDANVISDKWVQISLRMPLPIGGDIYEIVSWDTEIEEKEN